jgi:hypothetical protein
MTRVISGPQSSLPKLKITESGKLKKLQLGHRNLMDRVGYQASSESIDKLNDFLEKKGYSLEAGDGRQIVGFKTIKADSYRPMGGAGWGGLLRPKVGGGRYTVAMYGAAPESRGGGDGRSNNNVDDEKDPKKKEEDSKRPAANVPGIQDWKIDEQIEAAQKAELVRRAQESALFENMLQSISNSNQSPFNTYASANPSAWENILKNADLGF